MNEVSLLYNYLAVGGVLFAIGKMFHELATNLHPRDGEDPSRQSESYASLPARLRDAVDSLLTRTFANVSAAAEAITGAAEMRR